MLINEEDVMDIFLQQNGVKLITEQMLEVDQGSRIWSPNRADKYGNHIQSSPSTVRKLPSLNLENIKVDKKEMQKLMNKSPRIK